MQVNAFKSSDGTLHETFEAHKAHEEALLISKKLGEKTLDLSGVTYEDDRGNIAIAPESLAQFIKQNADTLRTILNESLVVKRGRGAGKAKKAEAAPAA